jgi:hypothetical protein
MTPGKLQKRGHPSVPEVATYSRVPALLIEAQASDRRLKKPSEITRKMVNAARTNGSAALRNEPKVNGFARFLLTVTLGAD